MPDAGILFHPPQNVIREFPQFPVAFTYEELKAAFVQAGKPFGPPPQVR